MNQSDVFFLAIAIMLAPHLTPKEAGRMAKFISLLVVIITVVELIKK